VPELKEWWWCGKKKVFRWGRGNARGQTRSGRARQKKKKEDEGK